MRMSRLQQIISALSSFYAAHEALGLFLVLLIEEAGLPVWFIPGDVLVIEAGSRPGRTPGSVALILLATTAGAMLGSSLLYFVMRRGFGRALLDRYGHVLRLDGTRVATVEGWFHRYGVVAIVGGRLVPGLRTATTVMAATFQVPYRVFAPATALGTVLWALLYYFAGALLAHEWQLLVRTMAGDLKHVVGVIVLLLLVVLGLGAVIRRRGAGSAAGAR
jgi:membrane protein DedA with SNARE-associated domain